MTWEWTRDTREPRTVAPMLPPPGVEAVTQIQAPRWVRQRRDQGDRELTPAWSRNVLEGPGFRAAEGEGRPICPCGEGAGRASSRPRDQPLCVQPLGPSSFQLSHQPPGPRPSSCYASWLYFKFNLEIRCAHSLYKGCLWEQRELDLL